METLTPIRINSSRWTRTMARRARAAGHVVVHVDRDQAMPLELPLTARHTLYVGSHFVDWGIGLKFDRTCDWPWRAPAEHILAQLLKYHPRLRLDRGRLLAGIQRLQRLIAFLPQLYGEAVTGD